MARWEMLTIDTRIEDKKVGFFGSKRLQIWKYVAVVDTPQGPRVLDESESWEYVLSDDSDASQERNRRQYEIGMRVRSKLIA